MGFAFSEALLGKFDLNNWVIQCGKFVAHGLRDFKFGFKVVAAVVFAAQGRSQRAKVVCGRVASCSLLDAGDAPFMRLLCDLLCGGVDNGVGFDSVSDTSACGVNFLVHNVKYNTGQSGVASDGLVAHEPDVDKSTIVLDHIKWVYCVLLKE